MAIVLSATQVIHFRLREGRYSAFPEPVRGAFTLILIAFLWQPLTVLFWVPAIGAVAQVLFGYCLLARRHVADAVQSPPAHEHAICSSNLRVTTGHG